MNSIKSQIQSSIKSIRRELIYTDIAVIVIGILMTVLPEMSSEIICRGIGALLCVSGLFRLFSYFSADRTEIFGSFGLVQGTALLGFGIYILVRPEFLASFLTVALGIVLIVGGVMKLQYAADLARLSVKYWWIEFIGAALTAALGIVALTNPFSAAKVLMIFIGISLIFNGIWDIISIIYMSSVVKRIKDEVSKSIPEEIETDAEN